jgi:hypothetical protein
MHERKKDGRRTQAGQRGRDDRAPGAQQQQQQQQQQRGGNDDTDLQQHQGGGNHGQPGATSGRESKRDREDQLGQHGRATGRERDQRDR